MKRRIVDTNTINEMKMKPIYILSGRCRILAAVIMMILFSAGINAGRWKQHPGFDMSAQKIIDSENVTYFVVLQKYYAKNISCFNTPVGGLLVYDKSHPEEGIVPLAEKAPMSGVNVRLAEYSPEGGFLAAVYDDARLDIIYDNGSLRTVGNLSVPSSPGGNVVNSMTICGKEIWLATETGFMSVDGSTADVVYRGDIQKKVKCIGRAGDRIVAFYDNGIYEAEASSFKGRASDFSLAGVTGSPANPFALMPVRNGFVYMANRKSGESYSVNVAWLDGGKWNYKHLKDILISPGSANAVVANNMERRYARNKNGWLINGNAVLIQIYADRDPAQENIYEETTMSPYVAPAGSWDYKSVWGYSDRGAFSKGSLVNGKFVFDDHSKSIRPNVPLTAHSTHMTYSPLHGIATTNHGCSWIFGSLSLVLPALVSNYDNKQWKTPSYTYNIPESALSNTDYAAIYNNTKGRFPCNDPLGIAFDPIFPDYVWLGSTRSGISAINLAKPSADPIRLGASDDPTAGFPGFKEVFPACNGFRGMTPVYVPTFDSEGRMWAAYVSYDEMVKRGNGIQIYWWDIEDRRDMMESGNVASLKTNLPYNVKTNSDFNFAHRLIALTHNSNKNHIILYLPYGDQRIIQVIDHKGTPHDTTDDEIKTIYNIVDQNFAKSIVQELYDLVEDPVSGEIWVGTESSLVAFNPTTDVNDNTISGRVLDITDGDFRGNPFDNMNPLAIKFDDEGRMWIGTMGNGLWCVSRDRRHILGHYMTDNSEIPGNTVYGMEWNPSTRSLMISTNNGYAEFWPDLESEGTVDSQKLYVYPRKITPDYSGNILIKGALPNERVSVRNLQNEVVFSLTADKDGNAVWNLRNKEENNIESGIYNVDANGSMVEIAVMR